MSDDADTSTEKELFERFFESMGVAQSRLGMADRDGTPDNYGAVVAISVAQAHFCFDAEGKYIGVLWDEMGHFDKRVEGNTETVDIEEV